MVTKFKIFEATFRISDMCKSIEDLKEFAIIYNNNEKKMMNVAKILKHLGFNVFEPTKGLWKGFHYVKYKNKEYFVQSNCTGDIQIEYDDFIDVVENKFKIDTKDILKKEFKEFDPYDEEDWDYNNWLTIQDIPD